MKVSYGTCHLWRNVLTFYHSSTLRAKTRWLKCVCVCVGGVGGLGCLCVWNTEKTWWKLWKLVSVIPIKTLELWDKVIITFFYFLFCGRTKIELWDLRDFDSELRHINSKLHNINLQFWLEKLELWDINSQENNSYLCKETFFFFILWRKLKKERMCDINSEWLRNKLAVLTREVRIPKYKLEITRKKAELWDKKWKLQLNYFIP